MMTPEAEPLLRAENLRVEFRRRGGGDEPLVAVDDVTFDIRRGEILCLVGESGSGKTTTARAVGRLAALSSGRITFDGEDVTQASRSGLRAFRRRVQFIFQDPYESLNPRQDTWRIVSEPLKVHGLDKSKDDLRQRVYTSLDECGLSPAADFARRYPHQLSGGQRQRVSIAAATVLQPDLLIADEPLSMLDVSVRAGVLRLLTQLRQAHGMTLLFVTHDLSLAWAIADRVMVMYRGRIMELGPTTEVIRNPGQPYTGALLAAMPAPDPDSPLRDIGIRADVPSLSDRIDGCPFHPRCPYTMSQCETVVPELEDLGGGQTTRCLRVHELRDTLADVARVRPIPTPVEEQG